MMAILMAAVVMNCDLSLAQGAGRNTYLPPEPTKGYNYDKPPVPFPRPSTSGFPSRPTKPTPTIPIGTSKPNPRPTPGFPGRPGTGYPPSGSKPTPGFPDYTGQPTGVTGNTHDHGHHEPGMPFDFNYMVKEDAYGNDYSHNAISDGDVTRGEYRVQLPDGRTQIVQYTADWKHGFSAQVSYEGNARFGAGAGGAFRGY